MAALALLGAVAPSARAAAQGYEPTGELSFNVRGGVGNGATFDASRVVGPVVNMVRHDDGGWAGDLGGGNVDLAVSPDRLVGANVDIHLEQKGDRTFVRGLVMGRRVNLEVDGKAVSGRVGVCSFDLARKAPGHFEGDVGCSRGGTRFPSTARGILRLRGEAAQTDKPVLPQFALALLAVLPG